MKCHAVEAEIFHGDEQTKLMAAFRKSANASQK